MAFCSACGAKVEDDKRFCTECGSPVDSEKPTAQEAPQTQAVHTTTAAAVAAVPVVTQVQAVPEVPVSPIASSVTPPVYTNEQPPPAESPYALMGVGGYVGAGLLMNIPVIGWLICIVWACGGCKNINKRNYARATLIFILIAVIAGFLIYLFMNWLAGTVMEIFNEIISTFA
ncbi:MAG: zinc ribbon domain-containing protein [Defluviitaleaceae bacterium]|nr:zinc ribbon domain-containing protein [Defluviitaleaceae bacterium]